MSDEFAFTIRPLCADDAPKWRKLWAAYLAFYETELPDSVYEASFARLLSTAPYDPSGLVAACGDDLIGLVHYLRHRHCWRIADVLYLQDLFVAPAARGQGAGRALIAEVYAQADRLAPDAPDGGAVYWLTQDSNTAARRLYDQLAIAPGFIKYQRPATQPQA